MLIPNQPIKSKTMKTILLTVTVLFVACISYSQNVTIPDVNFKNALISVGVDTNEDGEISYAEAAVIKKLDVHEMSISDMTGIEAFVNLDTLLCNNNLLNSLDVSGCTALSWLDCYWNQLTSLDVSGCSALTTLLCSNNQLTSLDVTGCTALTILGCYENQLTSLDVSGCSALTWL